MATEMYFNSKALATEVESARITSISRPARPSYERNKVVIPGRDGTYDFGNNRQEDFLVTVEIVIRADSAATLQNRLGDLATFVNGKHALYFTDAPSRVYTAQVYDEITTTGDATAKWARCLIVFECDAGGGS